MTYEIRPLRHTSDSEVEQCDPARANGWGVYDRDDAPDDQGNAFAYWVDDFPTKAAAESYVAMISPVTAAELDAALAPPLHPTGTGPYPTKQGETT